MDDGACMSRKSRSRTYIFHTQSFPLSDQEILVQVLRDNFGIEATIQKDRSHYKLYIRSKSTNRFLYLIRPYLHPCFSYKL